MGIPAVLWLGAAPSLASSLLVPANVTESPASSPKSLNSLTGFNPRWVLALALTPTLTPTLTLTLELDLELRLARRLDLSFPTSLTAQNTTSALDVALESLALRPQHEIRPTHLKLQLGFSCSVLDILTEFDMFHRMPFC